ncbi:C-C motif chemokine 25 [Gouania willdenowi]|uniref:C-C motif chemokine 25-like n=1 Tax=Gouania willdenowi TaxID=441366 RepID=A0A8C5GFS9_GOUWI|nr:C-C motif chemokine 25-like [Gouania willdenowi]
MSSNTFIILLILSGICLVLTQVSYDNCCLKYVKRLKPSTLRHAVSYRLQEIDGGCNIPAVILIMKRGRKFCTNPNEKWVNELMKKMDRKAIRNEKKEARKSVPQPQQKKG